MIQKWTKSIANIPILELHNYCMLNDLELDIDQEEIIIASVER